MRKTLILIVGLAVFLWTTDAGSQTQSQQQTTNQARLRQHALQDANGDGICDHPVGSGKANAQGKARRLRMASTGGRAMELATKARGLAMAQATGHSPARKWDLTMERDGPRVRELWQVEAMGTEDAEGRKARPGRRW